MNNRVGFACKWIDHHDQINGYRPNDAAKMLNTGTTTVKWLNENKSVSFDKLWSLIQTNLISVFKLVSAVSGLEPSLRMVRLSSDILPMYTEPTYKHFYDQSDVRLFCNREFAKIGELARAHSVRLSFHPGQFCVLASHRPEVVANSIEEFEYHVTMAQWMGYGSTWHDHGFKINVHISGLNGPYGIRAALAKMSPEANNLITIENEEMKWGLDSILELADTQTCAVVLDTHHHWIHSSGEYIKATDDRVKRVIDSWRGVRPTMHYSAPRDECIPESMRNNNVLPDYKQLVDAGVKRGKLRAHSDYYDNRAMNQWIQTFTDQFDIMAESKGKNLASFKLASEILV